MYAERQLKLQLERVHVKYISLENHNACYKNNDAEIYIESINFLKQGKRLDAIKYYQEHSSLDYNTIIDVIAYCENNLNEIITANKNCWFNDDIGRYEFVSSQELYTYSTYNNPYNGKTEVKINCSPLRLSETVTSKDPVVIENRVHNIIKKMNVKWVKTFNLYHAERENKIIQEITFELENILKDGVKISPKVLDWDKLKDNSEFKSKIPAVTKPLYFTEKNIEAIKKSIVNYDKKEPQKEDFKYFSVLLGNLLLKTKYKNVVFNHIDKKYTKAHEEWKTNRIKKLKQIEDEVIRAEEFNRNGRQKYNEGLEAFNKYLEQLEQEKIIFQNEQELFNKKIDEQKAKFLNSDICAIEEFFSYIVMNSTYPIIFKKDFSVSYNDANKILLIDYTFPQQSDIYNAKNVTYFDTKKDFKLINMHPKKQAERYECIMYQICFKSLFEIFISDKNNLIESVVFNGYNKSINKIDGQLKSSCILSLQISKTECAKINFANVQPKACFKALKGVAAPELSTLTPVRPILYLDKDDKRFVEAYEVIDNIDSGFNLASMNWQDFEHLVRELFEKEFSQNGGEVKITQSSRDKGVDAIAFDPDHIRGGKIVIQAKCYTNVVGVSAVRDLYGTVMNEGAIKGILITTSDYGADSYEFANGKPITLLTGANLLSMLESHGYKARIDLKEAKEINKQIIFHKYYVNDNMQIQSQSYQVHKEGCSWLDLTYSTTYIGEFSSIDDALIEAENYYSPIEPCEHCCIRKNVKI